MSYTLHSRGRSGADEMRAILAAMCAPALGSDIAHQGGSIWTLTPPPTAVRDGQGRLEAAGPTTVFAKSSASPATVLAEGESLRAMSAGLERARAAVESGEERGVSAADVSWDMVPRVHALGVTGEGQGQGQGDNSLAGVRAGIAYLVTDYKDVSGRMTARAQAQLGRTLALMHKWGTSATGQYGFGVPTFCGDTQLDNTWTASWPAFFADRRILPLVRATGDRTLAALETQMRTHVYPHIFPARALAHLRPAIQHGDLWAGNAATVPDGSVVVYDPASFYGHNEADLGMMHMFGGFGASFDAYHEVIPRLQPAYDQRILCYQLYHQLNHAVLFGWGYTSTAKSIMRELIEWGKAQDRR